MPLSTIEVQMTNIVVRRFLERKEPTNRKDLITQFKSIEPVNRLITAGVLSVPNNDGNLFPLCLAFEFANNPDALELAKSAVEVVLYALEYLFDVSPPRKQVTFQDVLNRAKSRHGDVSTDTIELGLYLVREIPVFDSYGPATIGPSKHKIPTIEWMVISEQIVTIKIETAWEDYIRGRKTTLDAITRSLDRNNTLFERSDKAEELGRETTHIDPSGSASGGVSLASDNPVKKTSSTRKGNLESHIGSSVKGTDETIFRRLSLPSREAFEQACGLRKKLGAGDASTVHMEHLIVGLYAKEGGPTEKLFEKAGLDSRALYSIVNRTVKTRIPDHFSPVGLKVLPPISNHVREALNVALKLADDRHSRLIHSRYLLYGVLSVDNCKIVEALLKFSSLINRENIDLGPSVSSSRKSLESTPESQAEATGEPEDESIEISSISDAPAENDALGFKPYVEAISRFLLSPDTKPPLTLSIEGEWGSGKSSFMLQLRKAVVGDTLWARLKKAWKSYRIGAALQGPHPGSAPSLVKRFTDAVNDKRQFSTQFNPWRHDREESLWAAFALDFMRQVSRQRTWCFRWWGDLRLFANHYRWKHGWFEALRSLFAWATILVLFAVLPFEIFVRKPHWAEDAVIALSSKLSVNQSERSGAHDEETPNYQGAKASEAGKSQQEDNTPPALNWYLRALLLIGGDSASFALLLTIWLKAKSLIGNPLEINLKKYLRSPDYEGRVDFVEQFHDDFKKIVDAYAGKKKVFVFIDDLDRCEVPKAADLMKAVNLLIADDPRLIFILGMDRGKVAAGLAVKYEKMLPYLSPTNARRAKDDRWKVEVGLEYGRAFLEKFIQLPFRVPVPNPANYAQFIKTISKPTASAAIMNDGLSFDPLPERTRAEIIAPSDDPTVESVIPSLEAAARARTRQIQELQFVGDSDGVRKVALMFATTISQNPRRLKQFINLFRLQAYVANGLGFFDLGPDFRRRISFQQLGKFVAITLTWPELLSDFAEHPKLLSELERMAEGISLVEESSTKAQTWLKEKKMKQFLQYGMHGERKVYTLDNPDLYKLLHICPQRERTQTPT